MQKHVNLVDLVKSFPTNIFLQNLASIQKRTSPIKFAHLAEKSEKGSISNLSTKALWGPSGTPKNPVASGPTAQDLKKADRLRSEVNNSLTIVNFFHKIQNFRQISDLFSQI